MEKKLFWRFVINANVGGKVSGADQQRLETECFLSFTYLSESGLPSDQYLQDDQLHRLRRRSKSGLPSRH